MAFDAFLRIDGINGESTDSTHRGGIELLDYELGVGQRASSPPGTAGGAAAERADFSELSFSKWADTSSPLLAVACASGMHIDRVTVELCRAGAGKVRFMEYEMKDCLISSFTTNGGEDDYPTDNVSIHYGSIIWRYTRQLPKGGLPSGCTAGGWNLRKNCKM